MSATKQPPAKTVFPWLRSNVGKYCFGALTGTDYKALAAAAQLVELYSYCSDDEVAQAFGLVVSRMQPGTRYLAFHAVAHVMDWDHRGQLWLRAGLSFDDVTGKPECAYAPGGSKR